MIINVNDKDYNGVTNLTFAEFCAIIIEGTPEINK